MSPSPSFIGRPDESLAGVIVPFDMALDSEMWRWAPDGVSLLPHVAHRAGEVVPQEQRLRALEGSGEPGGVGVPDVGARLHWFEVRRLAGIGRAEHCNDRA